MKISSEKQAGSRGISRYVEAEAMFCSRNFHVVTGEQGFFFAFCGDNVNTT